MLYCLDGGVHHTRYRDEVTKLKKGYIPETYRLNKMLRDELASKFLASIKSADFASYRDKRLKEVSNDSVIKELNLFSAVFGTARKEWGLTLDNPIRLIRMPKPAKSREQRITPEEIELVLGESSSHELRLAVSLAVEKAMRRGEIAGLQWKHIDLGKRIIFLPDTKNGKPRRIPLSTKATNAFMFSPRRLDGKVFGIDADSLSQAWDRACKRASIVNIHFHDLRHEATSRLFEKGLNVMEVASITGHKTLQMLQRYTHLRPENLLERLG